MSLASSGLYYAQKALQGGHCTLFGVTKKGSQIFRHGDTSYIFVKDGKPIKQISMPRKFDRQNQKYEEPSFLSLEDMIHYKKKPYVRGTNTYVDDFINNESHIYTSLNGRTSKDIYLKGADLSISPKTGSIHMTNKSKSASQYLPDDDSEIANFINSSKPELKARLTDLYNKFKEMAKVHGCDVG